jgi:hypothetical protein
MDTTTIQMTFTINISQIILLATMFLALLKRQKKRSPLEKSIPFTGRSKGNSGARLPITGK